jgi:hypothetical protein
VVAVAAESVPGPQANLHRNPAVVGPSDVVAVAPPMGHITQVTYGTFRHARYLGRRVIIFWPEGTVSDRRYRPHAEHQKLREEEMARHPRAAA